MAKRIYTSCIQLQRALRLLVSPDAPKVDRPLLRTALPKPWPEDLGQILEMIIQIILALLEEKKEPEPDPDPDDDTDFPLLASYSREQAIEHVDKPMRDKTAKTLAASIRSVAALINKTTFATVRHAREAMRQANHAALGTDAEAWTKWDAKIKLALDTYHANDTLQTLPEYKDAWTQIAKGLETL